MKTKRILSLLLALVMTVLLAVPVSAAGSVSEVYSDLSSAVLNGEKFDPADYPKNTSDTGVYLLTVNERGYNTADMSGYGLYIYLYNPSGVAINVGSDKNRIQMASAWTQDSQTASVYTKFALEFVSTSYEEGYEYVFYKFKVGTRIGGTETIDDYIAELGRLYDISGLEVQKMSVTNVLEYTVGMRYAYYGTEAKSNKTCKVSKIDTLELEVHHTYFRTDSSAAGVNHYNQLNAVYFNVPSTYWLTYDSLYSIQCEWEEYRTTPMIITDNATVAALLTTWRGRSNGDGYNSSNPLSMYSGKETATTESPVIRSYEWTYNMNLSDNSMLKEYSKENCPVIAWSFLSDEIELRQSNISSQTVMDYWETHKADYSQYMLTEEGVDDYDVEIDGVANRTAGYQLHDIAFDETFSMASYSSNHNWLQRLFNYNIFNGGAGTNLKDDYSGILAIEEVGISHLLLRAEELAAKYYINPSDADDFKAVVDEGRANGMKTIVFRFAVTDYFAEEVTAVVNGSVASGTTYRAEQTAFVNFDIISLTFLKDADYICIPVSSSPSDYIGGTSSPQVDADSGLQYIPDYVSGLATSVGSVFTDMQKLSSLLLGTLFVFVVVYVVLAIFRPQNPVVIKVNDTAKSAKRKIQNTYNKKKRKNGGKKS